MALRSQLVPRALSDVGYEQDTSGDDSELNDELANQEVDLSGTSNAVPDEVGALLLFSSLSFAQKICDLIQNRETPVTALEIDAQASSASSPSSSSSSKKSNTIAIAGGVAAGVCFLAIVGGIVGFIVMKKRKAGAAGKSTVAPLATLTDDDDMEESA